MVFEMQEQGAMHSLLGTTPSPAIRKTSVVRARVVEWGHAWPSIVVQCSLHVITMPAHAWRLGQSCGPCSHSGKG